MILKKGGGFTGGTVAGATTFSDNVIISGTLDVTGVATFTTTVTGSGNIMAGAAFALGFTGRGQFKSPSDGVIEVYATNGSTRGTIITAAGSASANGIGIGTANTGFHVAGSDLLTAVGGTAVASFRPTGVLISSALGVNFDASGLSGTSDSRMFRAAAGVIGFGGATSTAAGGIQPAQSANGATVQILGISELLTLDTGATTTDTTANLLPAGSIVLTVVARVTTTITTAANWQIGDPTTAGRFTPANSTLTAGTTDIGRVHITTGIASATTGVYQAAAAKVRITTNANPGAGAVRLTSFYILITPPTS